MMVAALALGAAPAASASAQPVLYVVQGTPLVNPFDFAKTYGARIDGTSVSKTWTLTLRGKTLKLTNNSNVAYLDGQKVTLSRVVGYAKGVLLAPHTDLVRLLGVTGQKAAAPAKTAPATSKAAATTKSAVTPKTAAPAKPSVTAPRPATAAATPATPPASTADTAAAPVTPPAPTTASADPAPSPTPATSSAGSRSTTPGGAYVIKSEYPFKIDALAHANYEVTVGALGMDVDGVVQACQDGMRQKLGMDSVKIGVRPFVFMHPENVFSVRGTVDAPGGTPGSSFTCLAQLQGEKLVVLVETQIRK